jgi:hypothetical protein
MQLHIIFQNFEPPDHIAVPCPGPRPGQPRFDPVLEAADLGCSALSMGAGGATENTRFPTMS